MNTNQAAGIVVAVLTAAAFTAAWRRHERGRARAAVLLLMAGALLLRAFAGADLFLHEWDERYHALVAKNLAAHPWKPTLYDDPLLAYDHRDWFANHVWLHKPPLALWVLAGSVAVFGTHELAVRLPDLLASVAAVALTYDLGRILFERRVAFMAALLHALSGFLIDRVAGREATDHVDSLFVCLVELGVWLAVRHVRSPPPGLGRAVAVGAVTGLAVLTKWLSGLLVPAVWAVMLARGRRPGAWRALAVAAAATLAVALPWNLHARAAWPAEYLWERAYDLRHFFEPLEGHAGGPLFHLLWMGRFHGELVYLPLAWFLWRALRDRDGAKLAVAAWFALPYAVFSVAATKMPAYVLIAAPALFLVQGWYWWRVRDWMRARPGRGGAAVLLALLVALPARYAVERVRPFSRDERTRPWAAALKRLDTAITGERCVLFNEPRAIEAMFYTRCTAYPQVPQAEQADALAARGYRVLVRDDGRLPPWLRAHPAVVLLPVSG